MLSKTRTPNKESKMANEITVTQWKELDKAMIDETMSHIRVCVLMAQIDMSGKLIAERYGLNHGEVSKRIAVGSDARLSKVSNSKLLPRAFNTLYELTTIKDPIAFKSLLKPETKYAEVLEYKKQLQDPHGIFEKTDTEADAAPALGKPRGQPIGKLNKDDDTEVEVLPPDDEVVITEEPDERTIALELIGISISATGKIIIGKDILEIIFKGLLASYKGDADMLEQIKEAKAVLL